MIFPLSIAGAILILVGGRSWRIHVRGKAGELRVRMMLFALRAPAMNDIIINGQRGLTQIDHVVLTKSGLLVLETKNFSGQLYDQGRRRPWLQYLGGTQRPLHNPQDQNYGHRKAVIENSGIRPQEVFDAVVLAGDAQFPRGAPEGVIHLKSLPALVRKLGGTREIPDAYREAWGRLKIRIQGSQEARTAQMRKVTGGGLNYWIQAHGPWLAALGFGCFVAGVFPW